MMMRGAKEYGSCICKAQYWWKHKRLHSQFLARGRSCDAATWADAKQQYANCCYTNFTLNHAPNVHNLLTCPHCLLLASDTTTALFTMLPCLGIADQSLPRDIHETPRH
ncbi:unnamed protein product [Cercospora beticola]|nr:unnamed protein product [Cercospora beticola]